MERITEAILRAFEQVQKGAKKIELVTNDGVVVAYRVVDIIRIDVKPPKGKVAGKPTVMRSLLEDSQ